MDSYWIGLHDSDGDGQYTWINNTQPELLYNNDNDNDNNNNNNNNTMLETSFLFTSFHKVIITIMNLFLVDWVFVLIKTLLINVKSHRDWSIKFYVLKLYL